MTGSLQIKKEIYYMVLNTYDANGKRKLRWISTGLPAKGNKKRAEKMLRDTLREYEQRESATTNRCDMRFSDWVRHWLINREIDGESNGAQEYDTAINTQDYSAAIYYLGDHPKDVAFYEKFYAAYYNRGRSYYNLNQYDKAINDCKKAMIVDPNQGSPYTLSAWCIIFTAKHGTKVDPKIFDNFEKAIRLEPENAKFYYSRYLAMYLLN